MEVGFDTKLWPNEENAMMNSVPNNEAANCFTILIPFPPSPAPQRSTPTRKCCSSMAARRGGSSEPRHVVQFHSTVVLSLPAGVAVFDCRLFVSLKTALLLFLLPVLLCWCCSAELGWPPGAIWDWPCWPSVMVLTNLLYGLGFWRGLFIKIPPPPARPRAGHPVRRNRAAVVSNR